MKILFALTLVLTNFHTAFAADAKTQNAKNTVDASCSHEQEIAHCGNDVVGELLFTCIEDYQKANAKTFKVSSGCKMAIKKLHSIKKTKK